MRILQMLKLVSLFQIQVIGNKLNLPRVPLRNRPLQKAGTEWDICRLSICRDRSWLLSEAHYSPEFILESTNILRHICDVTTAISPKLSP
ncbi:hypothetical protein Plhal304r1_c034g0106521 [Plasmopara halstedii]